MTTNEEDQTCAEDKKENDSEYVYVFNVEKGVPFVTKKTRSLIWQIVPSLCGCLFCVIFGVTLGWPSPMYPKLLPKIAQISITLDQSAMIAGALMVGTILGTPFSKFSPLGTKYGILLSLLFMTAGWVLMWQARNIYWLLGSRCLIGFCNGYALGQVKRYIKELCEQNLAKTLTKSVNLVTIFGIETALVMGPYVDFRTFSVTVVCATIVCFFMCAFLPHSPAELVRFGKVRQAKRLLGYLQPNLNAEAEVRKVQTLLESKPCQIGLVQVMKIGALRKNLMVLVFLVFFQQFSGPPATIVYCQIIFAKFGTPHPEIFAIIYVAIFFLANILGSFYAERYNTKYCLLFSSFAALILLTINVAFVFFDLNERWCYSSALVMQFFICFHTVGLGCAPFNITEKLFPKAALKAVGQLQFIVYSVFAIVVTKVFQVLFTNFPFHVPFFMFACVTVFATFFVLIFVPHTLPAVNANDAARKSANASAGVKLKLFFNLKASS